MKNLSIPVGGSDFAEIRRKGYYYVDKSMLIAKLLKDEGTKVTLITRTRRFGKTLGMSMLANFLMSGRIAGIFLKGWRLPESGNCVRNGEISVRLYSFL